MEHSAPPHDRAQLSAEPVRAQLDRILSSAGFASAERLRKFLSFVVEQTLAGRGNELKEYVLGVEVFQRREAFDPRIDTVVRVEAHRLRSRLKKYYETEGRDDPVLIELPKGAYAAVFHERESPKAIRTWRRSLGRRPLLAVGAAVLVLAAAAVGYRVLNAPATDFSESPYAPERRSPSIAVLPFTDLSPESDQEYFCDGITDEITSALTSVNGLRVVSRTSAFAFKGKQLNVSEIGKKLSVSMVLEGSIRKAGNRVRIIAQLIHVAEDRPIWSQRYDAEMNDVFAVQDEISRAIVDSLKIRLGDEGRRTLVRRHTDNPDVYQLYLKGRFQWNKRTEDGFRKATAFFQEAIEEDPGYALAYVGLAESFALLASYGVSPPRDVMPKAKEAALQALRVDETVAEAHATLGFVHSFYDWDWAQAEREYKLAIELKPGYATAHHWYSGYLRAVGRFDEALEEIRLAQELDPLSRAIGRDFGRAFHVMRRHDRAVEEYQRVLEFDPFPSGYIHLGFAYEDLAQYHEAIAAFERARALQESNPSALSALAHCYGRLGKKDQAERLINELNSLAQQRYVSPIYMAMAYMGQGDTDRAFQWLKKAYAERDRWMTWLKVEPIFDDLRDDKRFGELLEKVGLAGLKKAPSYPQPAGP